MIVVSLPWNRHFNGGEKRRYLSLMSHKGVVRAANSHPLAESAARDALLHGRRVSRRACRREMVRDAASWSATFGCYVLLLIDGDECRRVSQMHTSI